LYKELDSLCIMILFYSTYKQIYREREKALPPGASTGFKHSKPVNLHLKSSWGSNNALS